MCVQQLSRSTPLIQQIAESIVFTPWRSLKSHYVSSPGLLRVNIERVLVKTKDEKAVRERLHHRIIIIRKGQELIISAQTLQKTLIQSLLHVMKSINTVIIAAVCGSTVESQFRRFISVHAMKNPSLLHQRLTVIWRPKSQRKLSHVTGSSEHSINTES